VAIVWIHEVNRWWGI